MILKLNGALQNLYNHDPGISNSKNLKDRSSCTDKVINFVLNQKMAFNKRAYVSNRQ